MIITVEGDILLSQAQAIAHGVAPGDHFKNGLALALRERWPAMVRDFRHYCHQNSPDPGEIWSWPSAEGRWIVNLMVQEPARDEKSNPGKASTENINKALKKLRQFSEKEEISSLALPRLATGVGGLEWGVVEPLIRKHLGDLKIPVYVYTSYVKGKVAAETARAA